MTNLFDMRCPRCGDETRIDILASLWVRVTPGGTDADASGDGSHEWTPESTALCGACDHRATVADFEGGRS